VKRLTTPLAAIALGASLLTACSGGSDSYCDTLNDSESTIDRLDEGDFSVMGDLVDQIEQITDEAPDEVKEDWEVLRSSYTSLIDALEEAGVSVDEFAAAVSGEVPEDVDMEALSGVLENVQALDTDRLEEAQEAIKQHAKDECNIELTS
jgi:hypothetical protein